MIAQSVAEIVSRHVKLTVEGIDRLYLNVFVPGLQYEQGPGLQYEQGIAGSSGRIADGFVKLNNSWARFAATRATK
jgi:hypothetical protein